MQTHRGVERACTGTHGCKRTDPHTHRYLPMPDRADTGGDSLNDRLARAQMSSRSQALFLTACITAEAPRRTGKDWMTSYVPKTDTRTPADVRAQYPKGSFR